MENGSGKILFVEDEEINRMLGEEILNTLGYEVILSENGQQAIDTYKEHQSDIDLVLMDLNMPVMNGDDAFYMLMEIDSLCKVVITTGNAQSESLQKLIDNGLAGIIQKPYKINELDQLLINVLNKK